MKKDLKTLRPVILGMCMVLVIDAFVVKGNYWTVFFATIGSIALWSIFVLWITKKLNS